MFPPGAPRSCPRPDALSEMDRHCGCSSRRAPRTPQKDRGRPRTRRTGRATSPRSDPCRAAAPVDFDVHQNASVDLFLCDPLVPCEYLAFEYFEYLVETYGIG